MAESPSSSPDPHAPPRQAQSPAPEREDAPVTSASIDGLRARLVSARARRGACPPFAELQKDALPSRARRPGRRKRAAHVERCTACSHRLSSWQSSWEGRAAYLAAAARAGGGSLAKGAGNALSELSQHIRTARARRPKLPPLPPELQGPPNQAEATAPPPPPPAAASSPPAPPPDLSALPAAPAVAEAAPPVPPPPPAPEAPKETAHGNEAPAPAAPPRPRPGPRAPRFSMHVSAETLPPVLVFEAARADKVPEALLQAVAARGGAVATVESVEEVINDPDFDSVRAIVLTRSRPLGEWATVLRDVRDCAPGRAVLAVVPVPRLWPVAPRWVKDPLVLRPPVGEKDWGLALERGGWTYPT